MSQRPVAPSLPSPVGTLTQGPLTGGDSDTMISVNRPLPHLLLLGCSCGARGEAWRSLGKGAFQEKGSLGSRLPELSCSLSEAPK